MLSNVINGANVWMVQGGGRFSFALESSDGLGIAGKLIGQEFDGNEAMQPRVLGLVDDTHPASAQFLDDAVVRDGLPDHTRQCYGGSVGKSMNAVELASSQRVIVETRH